MKCILQVQYIRRLIIWLFTVEIVGFVIAISVQ